MPQITVVFVYMIFLTTVTFLLAYHVTWHTAYRMGRLHGIRRARASPTIRGERARLRSISECFRRYMEAKEKIRKND